MPYIGNITSDFSIDTGNITNRAVTATKLSPSSVGSNGQVLSVDGSGNLQWGNDANAPEGTAVLSTGESGTTKYLRVDGDGTCSWQVPPNTQLSFSNDANNRVVTGTGSGLNGEANLTFNGTSLGIGVSASTFSLGNALQLEGAGVGIWGENTSTVHLFSNAYYDGGYKYGVTAPAGQYQIYQNTHMWAIASSGTADAALTWVTAMKIDTTGFIGLGTTSPRRHFHIHNSANATVGMMLTNADTGETNDNQGFQFKVATDKHAEISQQEDSYIQILTDGSNAMRITNDQKVGIGTTSPNYKLELSGTNTNNYLSLENTTAADTADSRYSRILFRGTQSGGEITSLAAINGAHDGTADDQKGILSFRTNDGNDGESPTVRMVIDSAGRIIQKNNDEDIALDGSASGQLVIDGNGYNAAIANNATGTFLYNNSASRVMGLGVNGAEILRCTTTGVEQRFVNSTVYGATTGARKGHYIFNDGNADGCYASLELAATDADDYFGSTILSSIATGTNYSNDFVIQTRSSGNYGERMRIAHDGATTFSSTVSYTYSTPDGTITTNISAGTNAGDWVTIIPTGTSGIVSGATYVLRVFWHYDSNGNYPYYCAGGMVWVPVASNDTSSPYGNEVILPCAYHDAGFIPSLKVRALAGASVQTGMQATTVGWNPATNSDYRVEYKRIM